MILLDEGKFVQFFFEAFKLKKFPKGLWYFALWISETYKEVICKLQKFQQSTD